MKWTLLVTAAFIINPGISNSQISALGIQPKSNFSRQLYKSVEKPKDGISGEHFLQSFGVDAFIDYQFSPQLIMRNKLGIESKGYVHDYSFESNKNKFSYANWDINLNWLIGENDKVKPYIMVGLSMGYLYHTNLTSDSTLTRINHYGEDYTEYSKYNFGFLTGIGVSFENVLYAELEWNRDLLTPLNTNRIMLWNSVYSINVGINLAGIRRVIKKPEE